MEILNEVTKWVGSLGCLFVASYIIFKDLVWIRFYDFNDKRKVENRWRNDNAAGRVGGIGIFILLIVVMNMWSGAITEINHFVVMADLCLLFVIGFIDDVFSVNWLLRFCIYIAISISFALLFNVGPVMFSFYFIIVLFSINSFNMLDNMDLVSPITAFINLWFIFLISLDVRFIVLAGLLLPFIYFNGLGKLMMGDCGSTVLGALFGLSAVWMLSNGISWYSPVLIFIAPVLDTSFVLVRRLIDKRPLHIGGIDHLTHTIARKIGHTNMLVVLMILSVAGGLLGVLFK